MTFMSKALVVRSIDFMLTRRVGVAGELACLRGLKLRMAFRILFAIDWRDRIKIARQFKVALTKIASLRLSARVLTGGVSAAFYVYTYPEFS
jgi:hypothetical protein